MRLFIICLLSVYSVYAKGSDEIRLYDLNGRGFFVVDVFLNNKINTKMLVDTGASHTVLANWIVDRNKLPKNQNKITGKDSGGVKSKLHTANISEIAVGGFKKLSQIMPIVNLPPQFQSMEIGGIFSPQSHFKASSFILDFPEKKILVNTARNNRQVAFESEVTGCTSKARKFVILAKLDGVVGRFYLDTGGVRTAITPEFAAKMGRLAGTSATRVGINSKRKVTHISGVNLELGNIREPINIDIEPKRTSCEGVAGKLGADWLSKYAIELSANRKKVVFYK